jgi:ketosteroid isomerase-like protein
MPSSGSQITNDPSELHRLFAERVGEGNLDGTLELYEDCATLISPDGSCAEGKIAIADSLGPLLALRPVIEPLDSKTILASDIALMFNNWRITLDVEGSPTTARGHSTEVARRQPDGGWLYVLDVPSVGLP